VVVELVIYETPSASAFSSVFCALSLMAGGVGAYIYTCICIYIYNESDGDECE